jgi:hypothetical protein
VDTTSAKGAQSRAAAPVTAPFIDPDRIAFDVDGVTADTMRLFLRLCEREFGIKNLRYQDITHYFLEDCLDVDPAVIEAVLKMLVSGDYNGELAPLSGAPETLHRLIATGAAPVFVTARSNPEPIRAWLSEILSVDSSAFMLYAVGSFDGKEEPLLENGRTYFVEDRLETCFSLSKLGISPILFRQPWNRSPHPFPEVGDWAELTGMIRFS